MQKPTIHFGLIEPDLAGESKRYMQNNHLLLFFDKNQLLLVKEYMLKYEIRIKINTSIILNKHRNISI